jgi:hypothetical protein
MGQCGLIIWQTLAVLPGGHKRRHKTTTFIFGSTSELSTGKVIVYKLDVVQHILHVQLCVGSYLKQDLVLSFFHFVYKIKEKLVPVKKILGMKLKHPQKNMNYLSYFMNTSPFPLSK